MIFLLRGMSGVRAGAGLLFSYRNMTSVAQGQTDFIAYKQSNILYDVALSTMSLLNDMDLADIGRNKQKWCALLFAYPIPFALQIINHQVNGKSHPILKQSILFARKHVQRVAFAVDVCVSIAFAYYVAPIYGAGVLVGLAVELLNEKELLVGKIKAVWEKAWLVLAYTRVLHISYIKDADVVDICRSVAEVSIFIWEQYFQKNTFSDNLKRQLTTFNAKNILAKTLSNFQVNCEHLVKNPLPMLQGSAVIDIEKAMEQHASQVVWTKQHYYSFKISLLQNTMFQEKHPDKVAMGDISDELAKKEFVNGANLLAKQIANEANIAGNAYIRYDVLQGMLKSILKSMETDSSDQRASDLFQLSLEGGSSCASGKSGVIEDVFSRRILNASSLKVKILRQFMGVRKSWFDHLYGKATRLVYKLPRGVFDPSDIHCANMAMFYFDKGLKLHSETLKNDINILETGFCSRLNRLVFSTLLDYTFWPYAIRSANFYSAESLVNTLSQPSALSDRLSPAEVTKWWQEWGNTIVDEREKEAFFNDLSENGTIFGEPIQKDNKVNPKLLQLMLYDMNIIF